ncbi:MAG: hypothetical protein KAJ10_07650, partial [Thermodesulfovibrionia bacterium]|nr:hypothetical protein [Thermodesulfovibrionia bacterium]
MNPENPDSSTPGRSTTRLSERIPLTIKMLMVTIAIGISLWALFDYIQSSKLKKIFYIQLFGKLSEQSMEDRLYIDRYIRAHQVLAEFFVTQTKFKDHINNQKWTTEEKVRIKSYQDTPPWFPESSLLRILASPRYALLL